MKKIFAVLFTVLFVGTAVFAQSDLQVLAVVKYNKNESITVRQLKDEVKNYEQQLKKKLSVEEKKEVLNSMIDQRLVLQAAQKKGISVPESAVDMQFVNLIGSQFGIPFQSEAQLEQFVQQNAKMSLDDFIKQSTGKSKKQFKEVIRNTAEIQQYVIMTNQDKLQKIVPTDEQIRMFYEANKANFVRKDMADVIIVSVPKEKNAGAAKIKANDLREKLASKKITPEQLKLQSKNGAAGYLAVQGFVEKTEQGAAGLNLTYKSLLELFQQPEKFVSDLIEADDSYQFISIIKKYDAKMLSISDLVQPGTTITVYDFIRSGLTNELQVQFIQSASIEAAANLRTPENVEMKKSGAELDKLLNWGD